MSFGLDHTPQTVTTTRAPAVLINHRQLNLTLTGLNQVRTNFGHPGSFWNTWAMCGISQILYFCFYFAVDESQILEKDIYLKSNYWIDVHLWQTVGIPIAKECLLPGAGTSNHPSSTVACYWTQTCHYHYTEVRDGVKKSRKFQDLVLNKGGVAGLGQSPRIHHLFYLHSKFGFGTSSEFDTCVAWPYSTRFSIKENYEGHFL